MGYHKNLLERLMQIELTYSQMTAEEQAGQASVVAPSALSLTLCGLCLVTSIHSPSVHTSRTHAASLTPPPPLKVPPSTKLGFWGERGRLNIGEAAGGICHGLRFRR